MRTFTSVALAAVAWAAWSDDAFAWGVACAAQVFVNASFHAARLLDATCYERMRARHGWPCWLFHVGNAGLHWAPALVAWHRSPPLEVAHVACAWVLFLAWLGSHTDLVAVCDRVYVTLEPHHWYAGVAVGVAGMVMATSLR